MVVSEGVVPSSQLQVEVGHHPLGNGPDAGEADRPVVVRGVRLVTLANDSSQA